MGYTVCLDGGEGNILLNNVNVGKEFLLIQKCAFLTFDNLCKLVVVYCNNAEYGTISYVCTFVDKINMCCTDIFADFRSFLSIF